MKVVHICNVPLAPDHPDAGRLPTHPGRWVLNLAIAQKKYAGIEPLLVMQVPGSRAYFETELEGVPVHYVAAPDRFRSSTLFYFDVRRISRHVRAWAPDIVHAHGTEDAYALAGLACRRPFVLTAQGCHFLINRQLPPRLFSRERMIQHTERMALQRSRDVIAKSDYVAKALARAFPHLRLHRIPNTLDERLLGIPVDKPKLVGHFAFVGTVVPRKGFHRIRQALQWLGQNQPQKFAGLHLHVFGNSSLGQALPYEASELAGVRALLRERLHLHGTMPSHEVFAELARIPVLAAPSLEEMFGNQVIEAMAVGTWPVVTEGTAMVENVQAFRFGSTVAQNDIEKLADELAIRALAPVRGEQIRAIRGTMAREMGPEKVARQHFRLYRTIKNAEDSARKRR